MFSFQSDSVLLMQNKQWRPTPEQIRLFKGNFGCMRMDGLDNTGNYPYNSVGRVLWTPTYGCYNPATREIIRETYKMRGYTHFVLNLRAVAYHNYFPPAHESEYNQLTWLNELYESELIPVPPLYADNDESLQLSDRVLKEIVVAFTKWDGADGFDMENQPGVIEGRNKDHILEVRTRAPWINLYFHFIANYGSPCGTDAVPPIASHNADWWHFAQNAGIKGFLYQSYAEGPYDFMVESTRGRNADIQCRFAGLNGWPTGLDLINFENLEYHVVNDPTNWPEDKCNLFNEQLMVPPLPVQGGVTGIPFTGFMSGQ